MTDSFKNEWGEVRLATDAFDLTDKRALIIGAGAPAGRAIALALAEAGADITVSSITTDGDEVMRVKGVQKEIAKLGRTAATVATDVTLGTGVQVMVRQVAKDMDGIDILVNANDLPFAKSAESTSDVEWSKVLHVNLSGTFYACRAVAKEMLKQDRGGRIINVTSILGDRAIANAAAYAAAHAGVHNLTRALSTEWAASGITVNAVAQGWMDYSTIAGDPDPEQNKTIRFVPMKRAGTAEDVAALALYLASDSAGYVSGQILYVDGGLSTHL
jgi:NAD(P)-dependent dehydrogenase (short-subunit alcohol dehydrogenase family)